MLIFRRDLSSNLLLIFQCIAASFRTKYPDGQFQVLGYLPRPVCRWRKANNGPRRTSNFVETVLGLLPTAREGLGIPDSGFAPSYRIAGNRFNGQLQELFLVLNDNSKHIPERRTPATSANSLPVTGVKRNGRDSPESRGATSHAKAARSTSSVVADQLEAATLDENVSGW